MQHFLWIPKTVGRPKKLQQVSGQHPSQQMLISNKPQVSTGDSIMAARHPGVVTTRLQKTVSWQMGRPWPVQSRTRSHIPERHPSSLGNRRKWGSWRHGIKWHQVFFKFSQHQVIIISHNKSYQVPKFEPFIHWRAPKIGVTCTMRRFASTLGALRRWVCLANSTVQHAGIAWNELTWRI